MTTRIYLRRFIDDFRFYEYQVSSILFEVFQALYKKQFKRGRAFPYGTETLTTPQEQYIHLSFRIRLWLNACIVTRNLVQNCLLESWLPGNFKQDKFLKARTFLRNRHFTDGCAQRIDKWYANDDHIPATRTIQKPYRQNLSFYRQNNLKQSVWTDAGTHICSTSEHDNYI